MTKGPKVPGPSARVRGLDGEDAVIMEAERTFVLTDPATDQVLWVCTCAAAWLTDADAGELRTSELQEVSRK